MTQSLRRDERGLAIGFVLFFMALVVAALFWILADPALEMVSNMMESQTSDPDAQALITERMDIWSVILIWVAFVAAIGLIARAVFESGVR